MDTRGKVRSGDGSTSAPGLGFRLDANTGLYRPGADRIQIVTGGTAWWEINAAGDLIPVTTNNNDVGDATHSVNDLYLDGNFKGAMGTPTAYTPALTASGSNPTLGTSPTQSGSYYVMGNQVMGWASIVAGATGSVTAGSGNYQVSLPVTMAGRSNDARMAIGTFTALIGGVAKVGILKRSTTTTALLQGGGDTGVVTAASPGGWTNADEIKYQFNITTA